MEPLGNVTTLAVARRTSSPAVPLLGGERRVAHALLCVLVICTASLYRDFSYLSLPGPGVRIYVTEMMILLIGALCLHEAVRVGRLRFRIGASVVIAVAFLLWGAICLLRGWSHGTIALREFAVNYYSLLFVLMFGLISSDRDVRRLWKCILVGTCIAFAIVGLRMLTGVASTTSTGALRFHAPVAVGAAGVFFWCLAAPASERRQRIINWVGALLSAFVIVIATQHRSAALALAASLLVWVLWFHRGRARSSVGNFRSMLWLMMAGVVLLGVVPTIGAATIGRLQTIGTETGEFNSAWRLLYWGLLLAIALRSPIVGQGFGDNFPAFHFRGETYGLDPTAPAGVHNSFLFIFYKEGAIGLLLIVLFIIFVLLNVRKATTGPEQEDVGWRQTAAGSALVFVCVFACFNVVLEGPYMGLFFWLYAALAVAPKGLA